MADDCCICCMISGGHQAPQLTALTVVGRQPGQIIASDGLTYPARGDHVMYGPIMVGAGSSVPGRRSQRTPRRHLLWSVVMPVITTTLYPVTYTLQYVPQMFTQATPGLIGWRMVDNTTVGIAWPSGGSPSHERYPSSGDSSSTPIPWPADPEHAEPGSRLQRVTGTDDGWDVQEVLRFAQPGDQPNAAGDGWTSWRRMQRLTTVHVLTDGTLAGVSSTDQQIGVWRATTSDTASPGDLSPDAGYDGDTSAYDTDFLAVPRPTEDGHTVIMQEESLVVSAVRQLNGTPGETTDLWHLALDPLQLRQVAIHTELMPGLFTDDIQRTTFPGAADWQPVADGVVVQYAAPTTPSAGTLTVQQPHVDWQGIGVMSWPQETLERLSADDQAFWRTYAGQQWVKVTAPYDAWTATPPSSLEWSDDYGQEWHPVDSQGWLADVPANPPDPDGDGPEKPPQPTTWRATFPSPPELPAIWSVQWLAGEASTNLDYDGQEQGYRGEWIQPPSQQAPTGIVLTVNLSNPGDPFMGATLMTATRNP